MRFRQLQYLLALQKHASFSKTADALYVSQPTISIAIRELEEELGVQLLLRSNKGFLFTEAGTQIAARAQEIMDQVDSIYRLAAQHAGMWEGAISIGSTPHYCNTILLDVMVDLEKRNPGLHIALQENDSRSIVAAVREGALDLGIIQVCDVDAAYLSQELERGSIACRELFVEEMCVGVLEGHPLEMQTEVTLDALLQYPYGTYRKAMNVDIQRALDQCSAPPRVFVAQDINTLRVMQRRANGYTVIPRRAIQNANNLYAEKMLPLHLRELSLASRVSLVYRSRSLTALESYIHAAIQARCREYQSM